MKKINTVLLLVGLLVSTGAYSDTVTVRGFASCGEWVADQGGVKTLDKSWLQGYMSGLAVGRNKDILVGTDDSSIGLWMDNYCKANPLKRVYEGGSDLFIELVKQKGL